MSENAGGAARVPGQSATVRAHTTKQRTRGPDKQQQAQEHQVQERPSMRGRGQGQGQGQVQGQGHGQGHEQEAKGRNSASKRRSTRAPNPKAAPAKAGATAGTTEAMVAAARKSAGPAEQFVQLLPPGAVQKWYRAHLDSLPPQVQVSKAVLLHELAQVLDETTFAAVGAHLQALVTRGGDDEDPRNADLDPFLQLLVVPHTRWPASVPARARVA